MVRLYAADTFSLFLKCAFEGDKKPKENCLPGMSSSDVTKNSVPLRPSITRFLFAASNDVILFVFVQNNGASLIRSKRH